MPLTMAAAGEPRTIRHVGGRTEIRQFLEGLGFVTGAMVTVVSTIGGNVIVQIREARVAISREMAGRIMV